MKKAIFMAAAYVSFFISNAFSQPLPRMYVPQQTSNSRVSQYNNGTNSKYRKLKKVLPKLDLNFIYSSKEINDLLSKITVDYDGLRIYFAVYSDCSFSLPSTVAKDKLILLFSPGHLGQLPINEEFYFIDESDGLNKVYQIPATGVLCAKTWLANYKGDKIQDILRTTLIPNDSDNIDPTSPGKYYDTKSIFYDRASLKEAITTEETYMHILRNRDTINISHYRFAFSAFNNVGRVPPEKGHRWRNRLQIDIDYLYEKNNQKKIFNFEDLENFESRRNETLKHQMKVSEEKLRKLTLKEKLDLLKRSIDNGQLCPTYCPDSSRLIK